MPRFRYLSLRRSILRNNIRWVYGGLWCILECCTMSNYSTPATGALAVPYEDDGDDPDLERAHADVDASAEDVGGFVVGRDDNIKIDELYYSDGSLGVTALLEGWYVSLDIPLRPNRKLRELLREVNHAFDITSRESGYYLSNEDVAFVDTFTPDAQGRITVGRDYSDKNLKVIGVVVDE